MNGLRTAIVLGAGASYCYEDGTSNIPTQADIIGRLFMGITMSSGMRVTSFSGPSGLAYSESLSAALRKKFDIPYEPPKGMLDYWPILQSRGLTLETLYGDLEKDSNFTKELLEDFEAIVRSAVQTQPDEANLCRHHCKLSSALEPGDYIVNFNWDSLMSDALLYRNFFWFPSSGFGLGFYVNAQVAKPAAKRIPVDSEVDLFQVHGCVNLFELLVKDRGSMVLYAGPGTHSVANSFFVAAGIDPRNETGSDNARSQRKLADEEGRKLSLGYLCLSKPFFPEPKWLAPIFVPPTSEKAQHHDWYMRHIRRRLHSKLPYLQQIVIAGYSCPPADAVHLEALFPRRVVSPDVRMVLVNPSGGNDEFRKRVTSHFPGQLKDDDIHLDFKAYCALVSERADRGNPAWRPEATA